MAIGERIHYFRLLRGMTQKQLGNAVGFTENTADVRIAQYESGVRTPKAEIVLFTSQFTVLVAPTAAVAAVPREPTIAVSTYCTAVPTRLSSIVGQASASTVGKSAALKRRRLLRCASITGPAPRDRPGASRRV